jgi:hypothetical protein
METIKATIIDWPDWPICKALPIGRIELTLQKAVTQSLRKAHLYCRVAVTP